MPNHIQNRLTVIGDKGEVKKVFEAIASVDAEGNKLQIDFDKIKPMPPSLQITSGSNGEMAHQLLFGGKKQKFFPIDDEEQRKRFKAMPVAAQKEAVELAIKYQYNLANFGHATWYDWSIEHWGTKWNAYDQNDDRNSEDCIYFQTAWSGPFPVIRHLSTLFYKVTLRLEFADEDSGSNAGLVEFKNGEVVTEDIPANDSKEAYDLYFDLHPGRIEDYEFVDGTYRYKDEE